MNDKVNRGTNCGAIAAERGAVLVPSYDDPDIILDRTCGYELVEQAAALGMRPAALLVPCGGGGLLAGVSTAVRRCFRKLQSAE